MSGQTTLYSEDFNNCALPSDWSVNLQGNPDATWWVGMPMNDNDDGSTIDGSCMLIFDDDLAGDNTPPWILELRTPNIDISGWSTATMSVDVHFRPYGNASFEIYVFDGNEYVLLRQYKGSSGSTGTQFSEYRTFSADLTFYANPDLHLMFKFDDAAVFGWWAGIDNLNVVGEGTASILLLENFNDCTTPEGWTTQYTGDHDWQFGYITNNNASATSMNGSCMAYFDDDGITAAAPYSVVRLVSPEIDGTVGANMYLDFDAVYRRYVAAEYFAIGVIDLETGEARVAVQYFTDLGGPQFSNYLQERVDLTAFRSKRMKVFFQYDDASDWNWWVGIDNVKLTAEGTLNELCSSAAPIEIDAPCTAGSNFTALFDGPQPSCSANNNTASLWYSFTASNTGLLRVVNESNFNDLITLYNADCGNLTELSCATRDEHGFRGEDHYISVEAGQSYLLRLSAERGRFGRTRGDYCLRLESVANTPELPANDQCEQAFELTIDGDCAATHNLLADSQEPLPSRNTWARADVWYRFTATEDVPLEISSNANFADVITLYSGACGAATEVAINEYGRSLLFENPSPGTDYWVKISGAFATVEGQLCPQIRKSPSVPPANDACPQALPLVMGGPCVFAQNYGADYDGPTVSCEPFLSGSIWFSFVAPPSGTIRLLPDADFAYALSIYQGNCNQLEEVYCSRNAPACEGYLTVGSLSPGQSYLIRLSSTANTAGFGQRGQVCLSVFDAQTTPEFDPLDLLVNVQCFDNGLATLEVTATGGAGLYSFTGYEAGSVLQSGDAYLVVVTDANGCEQAVGGEVVCEANPECTLGADLLTFQPRCSDSNDGVASLENLVGGSGEYLITWSNGLTEATISNLAAGAYQVTINDGSGCAIVLPFYINSPDPITLLSSEQTAASDGLPNGSLLVNIAGGTPPYQYQWVRAGLVIAETTEPSLGNLLAGTYELRLTDANGCNFSVAGLEVDNITQTNDPRSRQFIRVAPNPTTGPLSLDWILPTDRPISIRLYTAEGRSWRLAQGLAAQVQAYKLDLRDLPAGAYWLRWEDGVQTWERKIIKQ